MNKETEIQALKSRIEKAETIQRLEQLTIDHAKERLKELTKACETKKKFMRLGGLKNIRLTLPFAR